MSEEFEKLDSPLVVHKETDASYLETTNMDAMSVVTHSEGNAPNLVRHRFKKVKKKSKAPWIILTIVIIVGLICGLYFSGVIGNRNERTTESTTKKVYVEIPENRYEGIITVKGTYIFFEGEELEGTAELERRIKYLDAQTEFVIQDEEADQVLLSQEIIPLLDQYEIKHDEPKFIISSGLHSKYEKTAVSSENTSSKN
ncbi:MAG: hypothetical protein K2I73_04575 [Eubacterium sp.]|nr:hypothetical protein [Eubacterium sp.]